MEELKPRKPEEINAHYFRLCAEIGEREFRITMMRDEIEQRCTEMQTLSREMEVARDHYEAPGEESKG